MSELVSELLLLEAGSRSVDNMRSWQCESRRYR
jgi:hypothetical protein